MKKKISCLFATALFMVACTGKSNNSCPSQIIPEGETKTPFYSKYLNKEYRSKYGYSCFFYENYCMLSGSDNIRYSCIYENNKQWGNVDNTNFPEITINKQKEYTYVFAQGIDNSYPTRFVVSGLFLDDGTYVTITKDYYSPSITNVYYLVQ